MDHGLINGVGGLVGEDAGGEAGHQLLDTVLLAEHHDVVLHEDILPPELHLVFLCARMPISIHLMQPIQ